VLSNYLLILASTSPRRRELLPAIGLSFIAVSPGSNGQEVDETPLPNESPAKLVQRLSRLKAETVAHNLSAFLPQLNPQKTHIVIAADTVVALDNQILGKPADPTEATHMLKQLRQQPHQVYSGVTVAHIPHPDDSPHFLTRLHQSNVSMRPYTNDEIAAYVAGGSPLDKAGAYGIQDQPFAPVARLKGCFASVMGLPLAELADMLCQFDISLDDIADRCAKHTGVPCCQTPS